MFDQTKMMDEIRANGKMNGIKTDDATVKRLVEKILNHQYFMTVVYDLFWETVDAEKAQEDLLVKA